MKVLSALSFFSALFLQSLGQKKFDYIVVGGGTAGCVVTRRLVDAGFEVALFERGKFLADFQTLFDKTSPRQTFDTWENGQLTNRFQSIPNDLGLSEDILTGFGFGGTTQINAGIYTRSSRETFDSWNVPLWSGDEVFPYFVDKLENFSSEIQGPNRGTGGKLPIRRMFPHTYAQETLNVFEAAGFTVFPVAFENNQTNIISENLVISDQNFHRVDSFTAYLAEILGNPKLTIFEDSTVEKVLFVEAIPGQNIATGIQVVFKGNEIRRYYVNKEVIISAGVFNSPKILQLSGIGVPDVLQNLGITPRVPLAVGTGLVTRPLAGLVYSGVTATPEQNILNLFNTTAQSEFFNRLGNNFFSHTINSLLGFGSISGTNFDYMVQYTGTLPYFQFIETGHVFSCLLGDPKSRGFVFPRSKNPFDDPLVDLNFYDHPDDLIAMAHCIERLREGVNLYPQSLFYLGQEVSPLVSGDELLSFLLFNSGFAYHAYGTCKMGIDSESVVGPDLKVYTFDNLRVADASIIPRIFTGLMGTTYVVGERAADFILNDDYEVVFDFTLGYTTCKSNGFIVVSGKATPGDQIGPICESLGGTPLRVNDPNLTCDSQRAIEALVECNFNQAFVSPQGSVCNSLDIGLGLTTSLCTDSLPIICRGGNDILF